LAPARRGTGVDRPEYDGVLQDNVAVEQPRVDGGLNASRRHPYRPPVPLHTEVMRQHLLTAEGPEGAWPLSGLIDFEPTMRGER